MTRQEIFNKVVAHSRQMQTRSTYVDVYGDRHCAYRSPDGNACFIGCLIPDDKYDASFEGHAASSLPLHELLGGLTAYDTGWLRSLQRIHGWFDQREHRLRELAVTCNLEMPAAEEET